MQETTGSEVTTYLIGDDIISQDSSVSGVKYLLYDGHGSVRQLVDNTGAVVTGQQYNYDAYGVMLGDSTTPYPAQSAATNLLYSGEQYDSNLDQYYFRARYYNQNNGTFNRVDPYSGNIQDPQSLHKYAYVHGNPINGIDPSGMFLTMIQLVVAQAMEISEKAGDSARCEPPLKMARYMNKAINFYNKIYGKVEQIWDTISTLRELTNLADLDDLEQEVFTAGLGGLMKAADILNINIGLPTIKIPAPKSLVRKIRKSVGPMWGTPQMQEFIGAAMAALVLTVLGWETTDIAAGYHGVDAIMKIPGAMYAVIEAKGGTGKLGGSKAGVQMYDSWIKTRVQTAIKRNPGVDANNLQKVKNNGPLLAMIISSNLTGHDPAIHIGIKMYPGIDQGNKWGKPFD